MISIVKTQTREEVEVVERDFYFRKRDFERMPWLLMSENDEWVVAGETSEYEFRINSGAADALIQAARAMVEEKRCQFEECLLDVCVEFLNTERN